MKIGMTADIHIRARKEYPERYNALIDIFNQCSDLGVEHLIIAGVLFDKEMQNYNEFESICKRTNFQ